MAAPSRTAQFTRLHKILKKHYTPVLPDPNRSVLEHLLFACCLENAPYRAAEESFAAMIHSFFDWNEIRVSGVRELAEVIPTLPDATAAATRFKRVLQSVFESTYSFELEDLRKHNLGPAVERLEKINGATKFSVAYLTQTALGGHSIPLDSGTLAALSVTGLVTDEEVASGAVAGLERAIAKNAGLEFGSLLHQLGADFVASPYAPSLHAILLEIEPAAKERLPSRRKRADAEVVAPPEPAAAPVKAAEEKSKKAGRKADAKSAAAEVVPQEPAEVTKDTIPPRRKSLGKAKSAEPAGREPPAKPKATDRDKVVEKPKAGKDKEKDKEKVKPSRKDKGLGPVRPSGKDPAAKKKIAKKKASFSKTKSGRSTSEGLAKRKPR